MKTAKAEVSDSIRHMPYTGGWAWWGVAAGAAGAVGHLISDAQGALTEEEKATSAVVDLLSRSSFHVGAAAGFAAILCLLVVAAGWWRWTQEQGEHLLAATVVPLGLTAAAGAMTVAYGVKGQLAVYLDGGINAGRYGPEGLYPLYMIDDLAPYAAWWGVAVAAAAITWLALRDRVLPRWIGVVSGLALLPPLGILVLGGLTGMAGVVMPGWLIVVSAGMALRRRPA